jgi:ribosomal protein S18 acetylase RimI-like enzyme
MPEQPQAFARSRAIGGAVVESVLHLEVSALADWRMLRAARLRALLDSPHAFVSSYADESHWEEPQWQQLLIGATWVVALDAEQVIGLAKSLIEPERPTVRHVESAWVAPTHRRRGVFRDLLKALSRIESAAGASDLLLWVLEDNYDAQLAYKALGFEPTGERQFLPTLGRFERRMSLGVDAC